MPTQEELKDRQKTQWGSAAAGWERWAEWNDRSLGSLGEWACERAGLRPGQQVLDLAAAAGQLAIAAARRVAPDGRVTATDIAPEMLVVAERRARAAGVTNIVFREMDAENLEFADATFDAVTFGFGLIFCPDPARAASEIRRVLKPGGRCAITAWDVPEKNPFFTTAGRVVADFLQAPPPDPKAPGAFRFAPPGELEGVLRAAGFSEVGVESRAVQVECGSPAEYWACVTDCAAALQAAIARLSPQDLERLGQRVHEAAAARMEGGRLRLTATALCGSGTR